jgi:hypothetical protein
VDKGSIDLAAHRGLGHTPARGGSTTNEGQAGRASIGRTILVIEDQPYLWAALRQRVDPGMAYVRSAAPREVARVWRSCRPWPWLVVGAASSLPPGVVELIAAHPIPVHWVGDPPPGLPGPPALHRDWTELVAALEQLRALAEAGVNGVRLLRNRGLRAPDGRIVLDVVNVEGLLAAPAGLVVPPERAAELEGEIGASGLPLRLRRTGDLLSLA